MDKEDKDHGPGLFGIPLNLDSIVSSVHKHFDRKDEAPEYQHPLKWRSSLHAVTRFKFYKFTMDTFFPNLEGSEIAAIPLSSRADITNICDITLFHQSVSPGQVEYTPESMAYMLEKVAILNHNKHTDLVPAGIWHFHPGIYDIDRSPSPSQTDMRDFKKWAEELMHMQEFYTHRDMTRDYAHIADASGAAIDMALYDRDAAIASSSAFEVFGKVMHGYALFAIFGIGSDNPYIGLGHHCQDCFDKTERFELLTRKHGLEFEVWDDPQFPDAFVGSPIFEPYKQEIARYIHPAVLPTVSARGQDIIDAVFSLIPGSVNAKKVSEELPMTAQEFMSLIGQYLRFVGPGEQQGLTEALRQVHSAFSPVYSNQGYQPQFDAAQSLLRQTSPGYDAAMRAKESAGNGKNGINGNNRNNGDNGNNGNNGYSVHNGNNTNGNPNANGDCGAK